MDEAPWVDTYRGTVFPWETDIVEHLTVAYYFERFADATLALLDGLGLGAGYMRIEGRGCVTVDCYVRYAHELRVGDILHISSAVIAVARPGSVWDTASSTRTPACSAPRWSSGRSTSPSGDGSPPHCGRRAPGRRVAPGRLGRPHQGDALATRQL